MSYAFFWIPVRHSDAVASELNRFLHGHQVLAVERHFVHDGERSGWAVAVDTADGPRSPTSTKSKVDYRESLEPEVFERFAALRARRKELSEKEGVPAYAVATNEQMAEIAERQPMVLADLKPISGFGQSRTTKYGQALLDALRSHQTNRRQTDEGV